MNDTKATVGPRGAGTSLVQRVRTAPIRRCYRTPAVAPPAEQLSGTFLADSLAGAAKEWVNRRIVPGFGASLAPPSAIAEVWARLLPAERGGRPLAAAAAAAASVATAGPPRRLSPAEGEPRAPGSWPRRLWRMLASIRPHCSPQVRSLDALSCSAKACAAATLGWLAAPGLGTRLPLLRERHPGTLELPGHEPVAGAPCRPRARWGSGSGARPGPVQQSTICLPRSRPRSPSALRGPSRTPPVHRAAVHERPDLPQSQAPCSESRACVAARTSTTLRTAARSRTSHRWES